MGQLVGFLSRNYSYHISKTRFPYEFTDVTWNVTPFSGLGCVSEDRRNFEGLRRSYEYRCNNDKHFIEP